MDSQIKLNNVCFSYQSHELILDHLNYLFEPNNIYGIIGLSGSGKTTFCKLLANLILPTTGEVIYFDTITITKQRKCKKLYYQLNSKIGYVMQFCEKQLLGNSVLEEVLMGYQNFHGKHPDDEQLALTWLQKLNFDENLIHQNVFAISQGQQRKVALASILILNQDVLIFDEPTVGLDYETKIKLTKIIKELKKQNKIIIIVSHDFDWLYSLCTKGIWFANHQIKSASDCPLFFFNQELPTYFNHVPFMVQLINEYEQQTKTTIIDKTKYLTLDDFLKDHH